MALNLGNVQQPPLGGGIGRSTLQGMAASGTPSTESTGALSRFRTGAATHETAQRQRLLRDPNLSAGARRASLADISRETTLGESQLLGDLARQSRELQRGAASQLAGLESQEDISRLQDQTARRGQDIQQQTQQEGFDVTRRGQDIQQSLGARGLDVEEMRALAGIRQTDEALQFQQDKFASEFGLNVDQFAEATRQFDETLELQGEQLQAAKDQFKQTHGLSLEEFQENIRRFDMQHEQQIKQFDTEFGLNERQFEEAQRQFNESIALQGEELAAANAQFAQQFGLSLAQFEDSKNRFQSQIDWDRERFGTEFGLTSAQFTEAQRQFDETMTLKTKEFDQNKEQFKQTFDLSERQFEQAATEFDRMATLDEARFAEAKSQFMKEYRLSENQFDAMVDQYNQSFDLDERKFIEASNQFGQNYALSLSQFEESKKQFEESLNWQKDQFSQQLGMDERQFTEAQRQFDEIQNLEGAKFEQAKQEFQKTHNMSLAQFGQQVRQFDLQYRLQKTVDEAQIEIAKRNADINEEALSLDRDKAFGYTDEDGVKHFGSLELASEELSQKMFEFNVTSEMEGRRIDAIEQQMKDARDQWEKEAIGYEHPETGDWIEGSTVRANNAFEAEMDRLNEEAIGLYGARLRNHIENVPDRFDPNKDWASDPIASGLINEYYQKLTGATGAPSDAWVSSYMSTLRPASEQNMEEVRETTWFKGMSPTEQQEFETNIYPRLEMIGQLGATFDKQAMTINGKSEQVYSIIDPGGDVIGAWTESGKNVKIDPETNTLQDATPISPSANGNEVVSGTAEIPSITPLTPAEIDDKIADITTPGGTVPSVIEPEVYDALLRSPNIAHVDINQEPDYNNANHIYSPEMERMDNGDVFEFNGALYKLQSRTLDKGNSYYNVFDLKDQKLRKLEFAKSQDAEGNYYKRLALAGD